MNLYMIFIQVKESSEMGPFSIYSLRPLVKIFILQNESKVVGLFLLFKIYFFIDDDCSNEYNLNCACVHIGLRLS